jgi:hypothetical protein
VQVVTVLADVLGVQGDHVAALGAPALGAGCLVEQQGRGGLGSHQDLRPLGRGLVPLAYNQCTTGYAVMAYFFRLFSTISITIVRTLMYKRALY